MRNSLVVLSTGMENSGVPSVMTTLTAQLLKLHADNSVSHGKTLNNTMLNQDKIQLGWTMFNAMDRNLAFLIAKEMKLELKIAATVRMLASFAEVELHHLEEILMRTMVSDLSLTVTGENMLDVLSSGMESGVLFVTMFSTTTPMPP